MRTAKITTVCGAMLGVGTLLVVGVCLYGDSSFPSAPVLADHESLSVTKANVLPDVFFALAAVILLGAIFARLCAAIGQPPVIGEVVAGIVLGPSLFGPEWSAWIVPLPTRPYLSVIAELGVLLYMFAVGLELRLGKSREPAAITLVTSSAAMLFPFLLGVGLALVLYPDLSGQVPFHSFALFLGVAMSITAFPVLARILTDRGLARSELGALALRCAAIGDIAAWCLLALVVGIATARLESAFATLALALAYVAGMLLAVRPWLVRLANAWSGDPLPRVAATFCFVGLLASAMTTQAIGIHAIFGAFLFGVLIPAESAIARVLGRQVEAVSAALLLPAFFASTGMRTRIDLVTGPKAWSLCLLIILLATLGKMGGTYFGARLSGLSPRMSLALGSLMNTRGLMELIVLEIGLDMGILSPTLFAMMVLMALATTMGTAPLLSLSLATEDGAAKGS